MNEDEKKIISAAVTQQTRLFQEARKMCADNQEQYAYAAGVISSLQRELESMSVTGRNLSRPIYQPDIKQVPR